MDFPIFTYPFWALSQDSSDICETFYPVRYATAFYYTLFLRVLKLRKDWLVFYEGVSGLKIERLCLVLWEK